MDLTCAEHLHDQSLMQSSCENCSICFEPLGEHGVPLRCGHLYHGKCIVPWLQTKGNCPLCRDNPLSVTDQVIQRMVVLNANERYAAAYRETQQRREEESQTRLAENLSGFKAFGHVKRQSIKDEIEFERRSAAYQRVEEQADENGADLQTRRAMRSRVAHGSRLFERGICEWNELVRREVANRWNNLSESEKGQWNQFAQVAVSRGKLRAEEVRHLLHSEPQLIATN